MPAVKSIYWYLWAMVLHLRRQRDRKRKDGKQNETKTSCFLYLVIGDETSTMSQFFTENMFFCELFSLIWFCFERRPRGLVYSSVHHLGNQKYNSDLQFHWVIWYTDKRFLCLTLCIDVNLNSARKGQMFDRLSCRMYKVWCDWYSVMTVIFSINMYRSVRYTEIPQELLQAKHQNTVSVAPQKHCVQNYRDTAGNNNYNTLFYIGLADAFV